MNTSIEETFKAREMTLVSGASGMVGTRLREVLAARGTPVLQLVRHAPEEASRQVGGGGEREIRWDPRATPPVADREALEGCLQAVHLSGANVAARRWSYARRRELEASRVESTRSLAAVLSTLRRPPRTLVVASAIGYYGDRGSELVDETSDPGRGFMAELCRSWEGAAEAAARAGVRVVHLRFGVILAREAGALGRMLPVFRLGAGGRLGSGRQWMSWVSLEDAVAAILFALDTPGLAGAVNVVAPNPVTNAEFTRTLGRVLRRPAILPVPSLLLYLGFGPMAEETLLASTRVAPVRLLEAGFEFQYPRVEQALRAALPRHR